PCWTLAKVLAKERFVIVSPDLAARFWTKVDKRASDECWPWIAASDNKGYGRIRVNGKLWMASRLSVFLATGELPPLGMDVCHKCDNPPCVNPAHLFVGSRSENMLDASEKGRLPDQRQRFCRRGLHDMEVTGRRPQ